MIDLLRRFVVHENGVDAVRQHPIQRRFDVVIGDLRVRYTGDLVEDSLI